MPSKNHVRKSKSHYPMRCMWFNELGWPRPRPEGGRMKLGCSRPSDICNYVHPDQDQWASARDSVPHLRFYPDGHRPKTPPPPAPLRVNRANTPPLRVKTEVQSPISLRPTSPGRNTERSRDVDWGSRPTSSSWAPKSSAGSSPTWDKPDSGWNRGARASGTGSSARAEATGSSAKEWTSPTVRKSPETPSKLLDRMQDRSREALSSVDMDSEKKRKSYDGRPSEPDPVRRIRDSPATALPESSPKPPPPPYQFVPPPPPPDAPSSMRQSRPSPRLAPPTSPFTMPQPPTPSTGKLQGAPSKWQPKTDEAKPSATRPGEEEMTQAEREKIWTERTRLMLMYVESRRDYREQSNQLKGLEAMGRSDRIPHMSERVRAQLSQNIEKVQQNLKSERQKQDQFLSDIMDLDFWPVRRPRPPTKDEEERDSKLELEARGLLPRVERMDGMVRQLEQQLKELRERVEQSKSLASTGVSGTPRLERDTSEAACSGSPAAGSTRAGPSQRELQKLNHRLTKLEEVIEDLRNEHAIARDDLNTDIDEKIEKQLEGFKLKKYEIEELKKSLQLMGDEIQQIADIAAEHIITRDAKMTELQDTLNRITDDCGNLGTRINAIDPLINQLQQFASEIDALRATVQKLSEEQTPPPAMPSIEELTAALVPRIMEALKPELVEMVEKQKAAVERIIREKASDLSQLENSLKQVNKAPEMLAAIESAGILTNGANLKGKGKENIP